MPELDYCILCKNLCPCEHHHIFPKDIRNHMGDMDFLWAIDIEKGRRKFKIKSKPKHLTVALCNECHTKLHLAYRYSAKYFNMLLKEKVNNAN